MAWDLRDITAEKFWQMESKPLSYQRIILSALDSAETANLLSESPSTKRRIQSASGQYAAVAFTTLPTIFLGNVRSLVLSKFALVSASFQTPGRGVTAAQMTAIILPTSTHASLLA